MTSSATGADGDGGGATDGSGEVGFWRNFGAAVLGFAVQAAGFMFLMTMMWLAVGADGAFRPGSWEVSGTWVGGAILIGLLAAFTAGQVCGKVSRGGWGVRLLLWIVVVVGVAEAAFVVTAVPEAAAGPRPAEVAMVEAMRTAQQPLWLTWLQPVLGVVGVLAGAKTVRS